MSTYPGYTSPNAPQEGPGATLPPPGPEPKPRNTIGTVALVTAIVGFIFACIPGALIVGWILLPISFILSIVGLAQSGKPKGASIAAIIVSIVGVIVGILVFMFAVGSAIDEAFGGGETEIISPEADDPAGDEAASDEATGDEGVSDEAASDDGAGEDEASSDEAGAPAGEEGSRTNPIALGSTISGKDWDVTILGFDADATAEVLAANQFNEEPAEGNTYALVEVEATYTGEESGHPWLDITIAYVTASGNTVSSTDSHAVSPEPTFLDIGELYQGASGSGYEVLEIPESDDGLLRVSLGMFGSEDIFVKTS